MYVEDDKQLRKIFGEFKEKFIEKLHNEARKEIENAQKQVKGRRIRIEIEDILLLRKKKRTIIFEE